MNINLPKSYLNISNYVARCDYIFTQRFNEIDYENNRLTEITDGSTVYCWSGFLNQLFLYLKDTNLKNITLISGCEDHPSNPNGVVIGFPIRPLYSIVPCPSNICRWYAQNAEINSDFMTPIPIGPNIFPQSMDTIKKYMVSTSRNKLVFTNFNTRTNPAQREIIKKMIFEQCPVATLNDLTSMEDYCKNLQEHIFSVCPPGNGKDTHRVWEALLFGCIPIVEKNNMNDFFSTMFPILVVDRWCDVTEEFLYKKYEEIKSKTWRHDLLDVDNWFSYFNIKSSQNHINYLKIVESIMGASPNYSKNIIYL